MKTKAMTASLLAAAFAVGMLAPAAPAHAIPSLTYISDGVLNEKGTAVTGDYKITCENQDGGAYVYVTFMLRQSSSSGKKENSTYFNEGFTCKAGSTYSSTYDFISETPFKKGDAIIGVRIETRYSFNTHIQDYPEEIILGKD